jgi:tRNA-specific 2-thiouridylase
VSERWLVAMSGGVDSSVAAALLARGGAEVVGITMDLGSPEPEAAPAKRCCGLRDAIDARAVAQTLGIRHYVANYREPFRRHVIEPFAEAYLSGATPIPCVACNRVLKFEVLLARARSLGARGVATGHYARIAPGPDGSPALYRSRDRSKDQTYFLFDLDRETLAQLAFPLGDLEKREVRRLARQLGLATADKPESQGICFIPDADVRGAVRRIRPEADAGAGEIVDADGAVLGHHAGAVGYTLGQRKGLGLASGPWYVAEVRPRENRLVVGRADAVWRRTLEVSEPHWMDGEAPGTDVRVQIRHRHTAVSGRAERAAHGGVRLELDAPVWGPAPGQAAVVYDAADERLLGGGWITGSA